MLVPYLASSQVGPVHGTVIVLNLAEDELVIAADSKGNYTDREPDYSQCKILTFDNQIVFAPVNGIGYVAAGLLDPVPSWDARSILREIIAAAGTPNLDGIVQQWANSMVAEFRTFYTFHPDQVVKIAAQGNGVLLGGIFARAGEGQIELRVAIITLSGGLILNPINFQVGTGLGEESCWPCGQSDGGKICVAGQPAVVTNICTKPDTERDALLAYSDTILDSGWDRRAVLANRLADLTEAYDRSNTVGGKIDVLRLQKNGSIRWLAVKDECRSN